MAATRVGEGMLLLIAARQALPVALFQAAMLDGAGRWAIFRHITGPLLAPWLLLLLVRDVVIGAHSAFTPVYIMTGGGPGYATTLLPFLIYEEAFGHLRIGQAAAMMSGDVCGGRFVVGFVLQRTAAGATAMNSKKLRSLLVRAPQESCAASWLVSVARGRSAGPRRRSFWLPLLWMALRRCSRSVRRQRAP
jgi:ABC-type Fe3+ transport system permease subunit